MRIVIAGSSGFIGSSLAAYFEKQGYELVLLSRKPNAAHTHYWNPEKQELDPFLLEGANSVINLSGENIFGRWNQKKMERIRKSRIEAAHLLCTTLQNLKVSPKVLISASAVGYYGDTHDNRADETTPAGKDFFLADLCQSWENTVVSLAPHATRVVFARFGIVLGNGGALSHIEKAFRMGIGGILGTGKQMMSWIAIDDVCSAMQHVIEHPELTGPVNFVAPKAVSNFEFTEAIGKVLNRPTMLPVPKFALTMLFGEGTEMFLTSTDVYPKRLLESGYPFKFPLLEEALKTYLHKS